MLISRKALEKLDVITQSGDVLGHVVDFEIDTDTGTIMRYHVKTSQPIIGLFEGALIIHRDAVLAITDTAIVVHDNHADVGSGNTKRLPLKKPSPVITRNT